VRVLIPRASCCHFEGEEFGAKNVDEEGHCARGDADAHADDPAREHVVSAHIIGLSLKLLLVAQMHTHVYM